MSTLAVPCQQSAAIDTCSRWPLRCATRLFVRAQAATGNHGPQATQLSPRCRNATSTATATTTALPRSAGRKHMGRRPRIRITTPTSAAGTAVLVHNHTRLITHIRGRRVVGPQRRRHTSCGCYNATIAIAIAGTTVTSSTRHHSRPRQVRVDAVTVRFHVTGWRLHVECAAAAWVALYTLQNNATGAACGGASRDARMSCWFRASTQRVSVGAGGGRRHMDWAAMCGHGGRHHTSWRQYTSAAAPQWTYLHRHQTSGQRDTRCRRCWCRVRAHRPHLWSTCAGKWRRVRGSRSGHTARGRDTRKEHCGGDVVGVGRR